ncbi:MAG: tetratricopeptide repeat protein [Bacteroidota bacterium]
MSIKTVPGLLKHLLLLTLPFILVSGLFLRCVPRSNHPFIEEVQTNPEEVLEYLNGVIKSDPDNKNALYQKAKIQAEQGNWESSLSTIDKALKIDFTNNDYFFLRGRITAALGQYEESIGAFKQSEVLGNSSHELYKLLSRSYLALEQPEASREVVNRLLKLDDGDEALILAGETLLALKDSSEALKQFNQALEVNAANEKALNGIKDIYYGQEKFDKAEAIVDQLIELNDISQDLLLEKVNLLAARDELDTAKLLLKQWFRSDSSVSVIRALAELEYGLRNYDSTLFYLSKMNPKNDNQFLLLKARALDKNRDFVESRSIYESILALDSTNEIARNELTTLRGKMSYLQRIAREQATMDSIRNNPPPALNRRKIVN